ncbi:ferrochelatase [Nibricoccus sp. IMCC34717]|uniref:ferrochelatase n=1 Tax=Nibricoccus sp. IMCC34717 TaxID=3034021 RepID=UPI00384B32E6
MQKRAVLLVNLGSPDSTAVPDVRRYLREFLGDSRVIDAPPQPFRWLLVNGIIVPFRAPKSAHAYASIWTEQGSPLIVTSRSVRDKLASALGDSADVRLAMRYGNPSIRSVLQQMAADGVTEALLFPQYPHYAMSSWETVVAEVYAQAREVAPSLKIDLVQPFFRDADYVEALVAVSLPYLKNGYDYVLFSYHGIPVRHLRKADSSKAHCTLVGDCCSTCSPIQETCYRAQCFATTREFVRLAGIPADKHHVSFQSRLAGEPWLTPYTDHELERLAKAGVKRLLVMTPAFVTDCLETLEEISVEGRETFIEAGGEAFQQIPCLNDQAPYIAFLCARVEAWLGGESPERTQDVQRNLNGLSERMDSR